MPGSKFRGKRSNSNYDSSPAQDSKMLNEEMVLRVKQSLTAQVAKGEHAKGTARKVLRERRKSLSLNDQCKLRTTLTPCTIPHRLIDNVVALEESRRRSQWLHRWVFVVSIVLALLLLWWFRG